MKVGDKIVSKNYGNPVMIESETNTDYICRVGKKKFVKIPKDEAVLYNQYTVHKIIQEKSNNAANTLEVKTREILSSNEDEAWDIGDYCKTSYPLMDYVFKVIGILPPFPHCKFKNLRIVNRAGLKFTMPSNYMVKFYFKNK